MQYLRFSACFSLLLYSLSSAEQPAYDVVIYGGTSAGVVAAVQTARMGKTVILIEPGNHLGGLTSGGLGWTDSGNKSVIGGVSREFYQRVKKHYDKPTAWLYEKAEQYGRYRANDDAMWTFEPHVAEAIYEAMLKEEKVPVVKGQQLNRQSGVSSKNQQVTAITMQSGKTYRGRMFIDATYEGDLMAAAGVTYTVGRESNDKYGETLDGVQKRQNTHKHRFLVPVDPYVVKGDSKSGLLPGVHGDDPGKDGQGDHRVQAYCFRMCMSNVPKNRVPFPKPAGYDEQRYELLLRNFEAGDLRLPLKIDMMPNGKTDTNNNCAFSTDNIGMNYDYPDADYDRRAEIIREHESYQKGLMWTLANHPRVPDAIRKKMAAWGLAKDEFSDNGNWPHQMYIREARRMVSDYVMTELDCRRVRVIEDSVGLGSYNMDSHNAQRYVTPDGHVQNEGDIQVSPGGAYLISYRSIVPRRGEAKNLFVPVCVSSSHIAFGSIRMEPVFMILGQSAATAAVQAIENGVAVQDVDYTKLRKRLLADKQVLDLPPTAAPRQVINAAKLSGVVVDDREADLIGSWTTSSSVAPFVGFGYRHDSNTEKGKKACHFRASLKPGRYEVRLSYSPNPNRATNVPVTVTHAGGSDVVRINQRKPPTLEKAFVSVGKYTFDKKETAQVTVSTTDTDGYVIVDAVQFVPVK